MTHQDHSQPFFALQVRAALLGTQDALCRARQTLQDACSPEQAAHLRRQIEDLSFLELNLSLQHSVLPAL